MVIEGFWKDFLLRPNHVPENVEFNLLSRYNKISAVFSISLMFIFSFLLLWAGYKNYGNGEHYFWMFLVLGLIALFFVILGIILRKWDSFTFYGALAKK